MIITTQAYPRAGLIGNPSDGYFGKTVSMAFTNFRAEVILYETPELAIMPSVRDHSVFTDVTHLVSDVRQHGYYGGIRLLKAAIKCFYEYCQTSRIEIDDRNFTIRYNSNIPHQVGLAGSSAIITACFRALMAFYQISIPKPVLANIILSVERDELGISAGLQDRVAQVYQGVVAMDFDKTLMEQQRYGRYEPLDPAALPPLYIAYRTDLAEGSEVVHNNLRARWECRDPAVLEAIAFWIRMADEFRVAFDKRDHDGMARLMNANFDKRTSICNVGTGNLEMVAAARSTGASATFTGSGGAIVGIYRDDRMLQRLRETLAHRGIEVIIPVLAPPTAGENP
jgi:glucuronokinase